MNRHAHRRNSNNRPWATAPTARALSTIQESDDGDDSDTNLEGGILQTSASMEIDSRTGEETGATGDEVVRKTKKKGVRQFRIPHVEKEKREEDTISSTTSSVPQSDDEVETAGLPFLDVIGKSLGIE